MLAKKKMTESAKEKINLYIKNGVDISDLIESYELQDMTLSRAVIKRMVRLNEDLSNINFSFCQFGRENEVIDLSGSNLKNCNFNDSRFFGELWLRRADVRGSSFKRAIIPYIQYQFADLRNVNICDAVFRIGSHCGYMAKVSKSLFEDIAKHMQVHIAE